MTLHVITLNIKASNDPFAARAFLDHFAQTHPYDPMVFCLQELDVHALRSGQQDVPKFLSNGDDYRFAPTISFAADAREPHKPRKKTKSQWDYGIGIFVRNAHISQSHNVALGPSEETFWSKSTLPDSLCWECEPRAALFANITFTNRAGHPENIWVANTHLAHTNDSTQPSDFRAAQIALLLAAKKKIVSPLATFILTGDFNATPSNPDLDPLHAQFQMAPVKKSTKRTPTGEAQVDHVFYKNLCPSGQPQIMATSFSDHKAVVTRYNIG